MKNKVYYQKQKINWNKNVKDYVARSNFKQSRSNNKKEKSLKQIKGYELEDLDLSVIVSLINKKNLPKRIKADLMDVLVASVIIKEEAKDNGKEPEF